MTNHRRCPAPTCPAWCAEAGKSDHLFTVSDLAEDESLLLCFHDSPDDERSFVHFNQREWAQGGRTWFDPVLSDGTVVFNDESSEVLREYATALMAFAGKLDEAAR